MTESDKLTAPGSTSEILTHARVHALTVGCGIDEVEAALRRLRCEMTGVDSIRAAAIRNEAIRHLQDIGVRAPAQLVDAALLPQVEEGKSSQMAFQKADPWPYSVDGTELLDGITDVLRRFVILSLPETHAIALWIVHTYAIEATSICPILIIKSAEKRCGKTVLMELLHNLVSRPLPASNITASALFRVIEKYQCVLLLDEADTFIYNSEELRGILNSGYRRSGSYVIRTVGEDFEPVVFNTFGPKAVAQIDMPPETIVDRGIIVNMQRKKPNEKPERLRADKIFDVFRHLRQKAVRWTQDNLAALTDCEPALPDSLNDRAQDSWRPLMAIAEIAGDKWVEHGLTSAVKLSEEKSEVSKRTLLLDDIRNLFRQLNTTRMSSAEICEELSAIEEHPWPEWRNGQPITARQLARMLEPLGIRPRQMKMDKINIRGYEWEDFLDSFSRYLPDVHI